MGKGLFIYAFADQGIIYIGQGHESTGDWYAFSGDSLIEVTDHDVVRKAQLLVLEVTFIDDRVFDSSREGGEPATFALNAVVPCFSQGIQRMKVGGKSTIVCPADIAYGDRGAPGGVIKPGAALKFEVELLSIDQ